MRFTVTWTDSAKADLANRWSQLPVEQRLEFTRRVDWLDRTLRENAHQKGAAVAHELALRFLVPPEFFERPIVGLVYSVLEEDRIVEVLELHVIP